MALTDINSDDHQVQQTFADHLRDKLGWDSVYAYHSETFGMKGGGSTTVVTPRY